MRGALEPSERRASPFVCEIEPCIGCPLEIDPLDDRHFVTRVERRRIDERFRRDPVDEEVIRSFARMGLRRFLRKVENLPAPVDRPSPDQVDCEGPWIEQGERAVVEVDEDHVGAIREICSFDCRSRETTFRGDQHQHCQTGDATRAPTSQSAMN